MTERRQTHPEEKYNGIRSKYSFVSFYEQLVPNHIWEIIFSTGSIPSVELNEALLNSKYLNILARQNWVRLWHGVNLSDEEFDEVLHSVEEEWKLHEYDRLEVVLHVFGMLLRFSKTGMCKKTNAVILAEAKEYIDRLIDGNLLVPVTIDEITYHDRHEYTRESYAGLGYSSRDTEEFKELLEYIKAKKTGILHASFSDRAKELMVLMKTDSRLFMRQLILDNHKDNEYYETPILIHIEPNLFVKELMLLNHEDRYIVAYTFQKRYEFDQINPKLIAEIPWLKEVVGLLHNEMDQRVGKISWVSLSEVIMPYFSGAIAKLELSDRSDLQTLEITSD
jgi:hypothetical protein